MPPLKPTPWLKRPATPLPTLPTLPVKLLTPLLKLVPTLLTLLLALLKKPLPTPKQPWKAKRPSNRYFLH